MTALPRLFGASWLLAAVALFGIVSLAGGCAYKGAKVVEGSNLSVGINVPGTESTFQLQVLNYLSGFRLGVDKNAILKVRYTTAETNSYFGIIHTQTRKDIDAVVEPCETTPPAEGVSTK